MKTIKIWLLFLIDICEVIFFTYFQAQNNISQQYWQTGVRTQCPPVGQDITLMYQNNTTIISFFLVSSFFFIYLLIILVCFAIILMEFNYKRASHVLFLFENSCFTIIMIFMLPHDDYYFLNKIIKDILKIL